MLGAVQTYCMFSLLPPTALGLNYGYPYFTGEGVEAESEVKLPTRSHTVVGGVRAGVMTPVRDQRLLWADIHRSSSPFQTVRLPGRKLGNQKTEIRDAESWCNRHRAMVIRRCLANYPKM